MSFKSKLIAWMVFCMSFRVVCANELNLPTDALVKVHVTYQQVDPFLPWQYQEPGTRTGYGIAVSTNLILTTENLVRSARLVQTQRPRSGEKIRATAWAMDPQLNLALLSQDTIKLQLEPVKLAERLNKDSPFTVMQFDDTGQIQNGQARFLRIAMNELPFAPYAFLTAIIVSDLNITCEGAPVIQDGKLVGMMMTYNPSSRTGDMLPISVIDRFLSDASELPYEGVASAGFAWTVLVDPAKREYLKIPKERDGQGILVLSCLPGTGAWESLKSNDVIVEWDGFTIDNLGFYNDPEFGRMQFSHLIKGHRKPGEIVQATVLREGHEFKTSVKLCRWDDSNNLIPENFTGEPVPFLVDGGYVLMELTGRYLKAHGSHWERVVDPRLVRKYLFERHSPPSPGSKVVILAGVLPDPSNMGFHEIRNAVVIAVNGKPIANMDDVLSIVKQDGGLRRISLQSIGVDVVIDDTIRNDINARLAAQYRIPVLQYSGEKAADR